MIKYNRQATLCTSYIALLKTANNVCREVNKESATTLTENDKNLQMSAWAYLSELNHISYVCTNCYAILR